MSELRFAVVAGLAAALLPWASCAQAQVYKCVDGGKTVYSEAPCGPKAQALDIQNNPKPRPGSFAEAQARREDYLRANPGTPDLFRHAIQGGVAIPGMTEAQVLAAMGEPVGRNLTQTATISRWQWVYRYPSGKQHYVYLENGIVVATN